MSTNPIAAALCGIASGIDPQAARWATLERDAAAFVATLPVVDGLVDLAPFAAWLAARTGTPEAAILAEMEADVARLTAAGEGRP
jgi:hypothetical protein